VEKSVEKCPENGRFGDFLVDKWAIFPLAPPHDPNQQGPPDVSARTPQAFPQARFFSGQRSAGFPQVDRSIDPSTDRRHRVGSPGRRDPTMGRFRKVPDVPGRRSTHPLGLPPSPPRRRPTAAPLTGAKPLRYSRRACRATR